MSDVIPQQLKPAEPLVFVMPEKYRGGAGGKLVDPKKEVAPALKPMTPPPRPAQKPTLPPEPGAPRKKSNATKIILLAGLLFLIVLVAGGLYLLQSVKPPSSAPPLSVPPPTPVVETPPANATPPATVPPAGTAPFQTAKMPGTDTDSDGLTDVEEKLIYFTDPRLPDTDHDGFLDGNEVFHRYNPGGIAPGTLLDAGLVKEYKTTGYAILYPATWTTKAGETDVRTVTFVATTGETVAVVSVKDKEKTQTLVEWFALQGMTGKTTSGGTKNGYPSLTSEDQLTTYIDAGPFVLTVVYDTGIKGTIDYLQTYQMMVNSVRAL